MVPHVNLLVFYITEEGEIISDNVQIEFGNDLRNFVRNFFRFWLNQWNISWKFQIEIEAPSQATPGEVINLSLKSQPKSFVGLLGVDQSVRLLKTGNDIEKSAVFDELLLYNSVDRYNFEWKENSYYSYYSDFWSANVLVMTNAKPEYSKIVLFKAMLDLMIFYSSSKANRLQRFWRGQRKFWWV